MREGDCVPEENDVLDNGFLTNKEDAVLVVGRDDDDFDCVSTVDCERNKSNEGGFALNKLTVAGLDVFTAGASDTDVELAFPNKDFPGVN